MKLSLYKKNTLLISVAGSIIVALILLIGTYWTGKSAEKDTSAAVRNVSLLYLDELAGRREQVVESILEDYISDMDVAIGLLDANDLSSVENLQAYQARMKQLYDVEKFAFVDENGLIYTSRGTRTDIDIYDFDYQTISEPEISIKNGEGDNQKVIIAAPTDHLPFAGHELVASFMEIDMDILLNAMSLQSESNNTTFCNIYTSGGRALTNLVLGGLAREDNLLDAMENASLDKGYNMEKVRDDFSVGRKGYVSFTYNGIAETLYYVPVHHTDWMLTYLIRESVISEQIGTISNGIIHKNLLQMVLTAAVLAAVFIVLIRQTRRMAKLSVERETQESFQQELEERIALQDELLEQEKTRAQQDNMITALASDYRSVYYVSLDTDDSICFRSDEEDDEIAEGAHFHFLATFTDYANRYVDKDYVEGFLDFIQPENIRRSLEKEPLIAYRYLVHKNGRDRYEMLRMAGVRHAEDREDGIVHAVGVGFTDIDSEMRDSMSKNQALSDALSAAEEASKAKTLFLSNMSHEIRTPMNAIIGLDSLALNETDLSDSTRDYLEKIGSSAQHLLGLINDILDMSRIESGRMILHNEEFDFQKLIDQICILIDGQCREKGVEYECKTCEGLNDFYIGDSMKLKQVLINILSNAVKFTPTGGNVEFSVDRTASYGGKSTLQFKIKDTGVGMSEEYLPKLFDPFSKESEDSVNKYGSSGLGMAITKSLVEMMNGTIEVESTKGVGTTFTVSITLKESNQVKAEPRDDAKSGCETGHNESASEISAKRVLLAEDMEINAQIMINVLAMKNVEADLAENGKVAVEMFESSVAGYYDAILMDMRMPEMDGLAATRVIRSLNRSDAKTIPIIALTANAFDEDVQRSLQAGLNAHLAKPVQPELLFDTLDALIKK